MLEICLVDSKIGRVLRPNGFMVKISACVTDSMCVPGVYRLFVIVKTIAVVQSYRVVAGGGRRVSRSIRCAANVGL